MGILNTMLECEGLMRYGSYKSFLCLLCLGSRQNKMCPLDAFVGRVGLVQVMYGCFYEEGVKVCRGPQEKNL